MFRKIFSLSIIVLLVLLTATGCGEKDKKTDSTPAMTNDDETGGLPIRETLVYYQDDAGYLVPVMRKIPWEEGIAKATIRLMMDTPEQQEDLMSMGLRALLPEDAKILGMDIKEGIARLDLNSAAAEFDTAIEESNMVQGLVLTLVEFSTIDKVQFLFDGKIRDTLKFGTKVGEPLGPQDVNLEMSVDGDTKGGKVTVFFQSTSPSDYDYLVPITRITSSETVTLETAIKELLNGPKELSNVYTDLPQGTKLLGIQMKDGITYINFSKEFEALGNSKESESLVFKAIYLTARQFPEVDKVKILVEGDEYEGAPAESMAVFANQF